MMNNMGGDDLPDFDGAEEVSYVYYFLMIFLKFTRWNSSSHNFVFVFQHDSADGGDESKYDFKKNPAKL